jgi:HK97 family phage portal protein
MANIFTKIFTKEKTIEPEAPLEKRDVSNFDDFFYNPVLGTFNFQGYNTYSNMQALKLSVVYRCVQVISDSIAVLPFEPYEIRNNWKYKLTNDLSYLLNVQPNPLMSAYTFKKQIIEFILTLGNAYILIKRDSDNNVKELQLLDSRYVMVMIDGTQITFNSTFFLNPDGKKTYHNIATGDYYDDSDIIHIMNHSVNGVIGMSTIQSAAMTLGIAYAAEDHVQNFFSGGANLNGILRPLAGVNMNGQKAADAKNNFINALNSNAGGKSGSIVVLDSGLEYQPISVNPREAQLLESRQFGIGEICRFFGCPVEKVFDMQHSRAGTSESSQIDFYNSTLLGYIEKVENEFGRKIFTRIEYGKTGLLFDVEKLMRMDSSAQSEYYTKMFGIGALTSNEIREKINAGQPVKGGNDSYISTNLQKLSNPVVQGANPDPVPTGFVDNKLKIDNTNGKQ